MSTIEIQNLCKTYYSVKKQPGVSGALKSLFSREKEAKLAVYDVSFTIEEGELVGFLGPNGAGKTTVLKMLSGILHPSSGHINILGFEPWERNTEYLRQISLVMGNKNQLWWDLPAMESFIVLKELYDVPQADFEKRLEFLLEELQLKDKVNTQVRKMSLGERMKCELVASLIHLPRVIFLDEPTIGLDLVSQKRIRDFLAEFNRNERSTILLTSHYMQDVKELCERVILIDHGQIMFDGTLNRLMADYSDQKMLRLRFNSQVDNADLLQYGKIIEAGEDETEENTVLLSIPRADTPQITAAVLGNLPVADIALEDITLDEVIRNLFDTRSGVSRETVSD